MIEHRSQFVFIHYLICIQIEHREQQRSRLEGVSPQTYCQNTHKVAELHALVVALRYGE